MARREAFSFAWRALTQLSHVGNLRAEARSGTRVHRNPSTVGLIELVREDYETHERNLLSPGFWAVAVHRMGCWRRSGQLGAFAYPLWLVHGVLRHSVVCLWGIEIDASVRLGRRVHIWHQGGIVLAARSVGCDVHIRQNTTFGSLRRSEPDKRPNIGDRVDVGTGACVLGDITIGNDTLIGANAVVLRSCGAHSVLVGVPARNVSQCACAEE